MKRYFRMKYEQWLVRIFDHFCDLISKSRMDWYPRYKFCKDLEDKIWEQEKKITDLEFELLAKEAALNNIKYSLNEKCES